MIVILPWPQLGGGPHVPWRGLPKTWGHLVRSLIKKARGVGSTETGVVVGENVNINSLTDEYGIDLKELKLRKIFELGSFHKDINLFTSFKIKRTKKSD